MAPVPLPERLVHAFEAIDRIEKIWSGKTFEAYASDPVLSAATERFLEKICEAVKHIPDDMKSEYPQIPWAQIRGLGNRLRHGYETIDAVVVWDIVRNDLTPLRAALLAIRATAASRDQ